MKKISISVVLLSVSVQFVAAADSTPDQLAEKVARSQPHARRLLDMLKKEARHIRDSRMREDALKLLDRPEFTVIAARKGADSELVARLKSEGLYDDTTGAPLIPTHSPMRFMAAPGASWSGHHAYPAGLVYHTLANVRIGLGFGAAYRDIYRIRLDEDLIRAAAIWHDCAKTMTLAWNADGSASAGEPKLGGTQAHHIWAVAEALHRGYSARFIVTLAAAHSSPLPGPELQQLLNFLKTGAIVAGVPYAKAGLTDDGKALAALPPIEAFITHMDDHDYVLSVPAMTLAAAELRGLSNKESGAPVGDHWARNKALAGVGEIAVYHRLSTGAQR